MGISGVRSRINSTRRSDSVPEERGVGSGTATLHSSELPQMRGAPVDQEPRGPEAPPTDTEGEQQSPLPPVDEEPRAAADNENTAGSGVDLGQCDPAHLRQFWQQMGIRPDVPGGSLGVTGPED
jgi:hypothetical protein